MSVTAVHVIVYGSVQGVGFRFFVREIAFSCGVMGWVKNLPDGTVEIHAEGDNEILDDFINKVEKGPTFGYVTELKIDWIIPENKYSGFNISF